MPIEYKAVKAFTMGIEDRTVTGIFCVHGNLDDGDGWTSRGDRSHPGLFGDFTVEGRRRAVFLWQHDAHAPPTAKIDQLFEVAAADLPAAVRLYAPDASGGVGVKRTYLDTPRGNEVLSALKAGAISEMSYAYDPTRWDYEKQDEGDRQLPIRNLYQADLYDISDVNWGMNPATSADGLKGRPIAVEHATVLAAVAAYTERYQQLSDLRAKEGRVLSGENRERIKAAVSALDDASAALNDLLTATEPKDPKQDRRNTQQLYHEWARLRQAARTLGEHL